MTEEKTRSVHLNGWDVAYAIDFKDANRIIVKKKSSPTNFSYTTESGNMIGGNFGDWQLKVGGSGHLVWMDIPINNVIYDFKIERKKYEIKSANIVAEVSLTWVEDSEKVFNLRLCDETDMTIEKLNIGESVPKLDPESDPYILLKGYIREMLEEKKKEFAHIFATLDYTREATEAAKKLSWLHITDHEYRVSTSEKGDQGYLVILGMTEGREKPSEFVGGSTLIPKACNAGFAFNEWLVLENMVRPGLKYILPNCDPNKDFDYTNDSRTILQSGQKELHFKKQKVDFNQFGDKDDYVYPILPYDKKKKNFGSMTISVNNGQLWFTLDNAQWTHKGNPIFTKYDNLVIMNGELKGSVKLVKGKDDKNKNLIAFNLDKNSQIHSRVAPIIPDPSWGSFWRQEGVNFAVSLGVMVLTMGTMKVFESIGRKCGGISKGADDAASGNFNPEDESVIDGNAVDKEIQNLIDSGQESESTDTIDNSNSITRSTQQNMDRNEGKLSGFLKNSWGALGLFFIIQSMYNLGWSTLDFLKNMNFNKEKDIPDFKKFADQAFLKVNWPDVEDYDIVNGELVDGSFSIGLNLNFKDQ